MSAIRRGLRAELAAILDVEPYTLDDLAGTSPPPAESTSTHLATLITRSTTHKDDARTVYEFLPLILLRLLGYGTSPGWLETICELPSKDRDALVHLLLPHGPILSFCAQHSPSRDAKLDVHRDMRYEFPRANLPLATNEALDGAVKTGIRDAQSFLAPFLNSALPEHKDQALYLTPLDYFYVCLIAAPTQKWSPAAPTHGARRLKRSVSLPSTRALYNQIIFAHASTLKASAKAGQHAFFLATCLDFLFSPWAAGDNPPPSVATAEAIACLMLALAPSSPSALQVTDREWQTQTNSAAIYGAAEAMLDGALRAYDQGASSGTLVVYLRLLALYIAPWRASIRTALRAQLLPKPKTKNGRAHTMAALTSTLTSLNGHSPGNVSSVKESRWRMEMRERQRVVDEELVRVAIVKAANRRLPGLVEGGKALSLLAEATQAARLCGGSVEHDRMEELRSCLFALRNQKVEAEKQGGARERNYVGSLGSAIGIRVENGVLHGISEMVGGNGSSGKGKGKRIQQRRMWALRGDDGEVPFLGDVWERPISESENEMVVLWLYWLALRLEPRLGFVPNLRFLGRYWLIMLGSVMVCSGYVVARMVLTL